VLLFTQRLHAAKKEFILMVKSQDVYVERRKYIRFKIPIGMDYTLPGNDNIRHATTVDISADGLKFEVNDKGLSENSSVELKLNMPGAVNPIHARGKIVWKKKLSLENGSPSSYGMEFTQIEEDNKNTFLKFLCDLTYNLSKEKKHAHQDR
jgi:c-di-GMP-binding flagellar brake protein YcgR